MIALRRLATKRNLAILLILNEVRGAVVVAYLIYTWRLFQ